MDARALLDPRQRRPLAIVLRAVLRLGAIPYGWAVRIRNRRFDRGGLPTHRVDAPVICVGNITAGGTGKTPMVAAISRYLRNQGRHVALVSRGYGAAEDGNNDEARELYDLLPDVPHVQNPDRVAAARTAIEELEMDTIVLDDGFQHRYLGRNLDIVMIDATCPFGFGRLIPAGLLREPLSGLKRADYIMISRASRVSPDELIAIQKTIDRYAPGVPTGTCDHQPAEWIDHQGNGQALASLDGKPAFAFAGIGNPEPFFAAVKEQGLKLVGTQTLPDHCDYDRATVESLSEKIRLLATEHPDLKAVCTHKDLVKLRTSKLGGVSLWALRIELCITHGAAIFWHLIDQTTATAPHSHHSPCED